MFDAYIARTRYPFVLNHSGAFGLWGQKFAAAKFLEVAQHIMGVDSVYADGGASGVKPILMEDYVLKYLTVSEAPHQYTLIERMREEEARPTLITPTLFFFGPLPPEFHSNEGGEQFTTMQIAVNIAHCLSDLPPQFLDGAEVTCFDLKGNFLYTDEQRQVSCFQTYDSLFSHSSLHTALLAGRQRFLREHAAVGCAFHGVEQPHG